MDGVLLKNMIMAAASLLMERKPEIDEMNVFPVPDGDTGTNMSFTMLAAAAEAEKVTENSVSAVANAASSGSLRGARGNSGVILSQLVRGFAKGLEGCVTADNELIAKALAKALETAFKAVMKPREGTILTVARAISVKAAEIAPHIHDETEFLREILAAGHEMLKKTPDMLPALKAANVCDAGGAGLLCLLEGAYNCMTGAKHTPLNFGGSQKAASLSGVGATADEEITFGYCTEFFILSNEITEKDEELFKAYLDTVGDSIVCFADGGMMKTHVHTDEPGSVLQKALQIGQLSNIKIENMRIQHTEAVSFSSNETAAPSPAKPFKETGIVAVSCGDGITEMFLQLGADEIIEGGQSMNPSTDDILKAIAKVNAGHILVFPNNSNIILAAEQAASLTTDKKIHVIPAKSIPQGISSLAHFMPSAPVDENIENMTNALALVNSGQVTYAVRNSEVNGKPIHENDIIAIVNGQIEVVESTINSAVHEAISLMKNDESEIITIFYGQEISEDDANALSDEIATNHPGMELEVLYGGQPIYYYYISVE